MYFLEINCMQFKAFNFTLLCSFSRFFFTWIPISYHDFLLKWSCILKIMMNSRSHYKTCYSLCLQLKTKMKTIFPIFIPFIESSFIYLFLTAVKNKVFWCKNILSIIHIMYLLMTLCLVAKQLMIILFVETHCNCIVLIS